MRSVQVLCLACLLLAHHQAPRRPNRHPASTTIALVQPIEAHHLEDLCRPTFLTNFISYGT